MAFNNLPHTTSFIINGVKYQDSSSGKGNAYDGLLTGRLEHDFTFDPEILAAFLYVGYPTYSEYRAGATDLFKPSTLNGGYKYQRSWTFSNGAHFTSYHTITYDEKTGLSGVFSTQDFPTQAFVGRWKISDLVETFIPHGQGTIKGLMAVEWKNEAGEQLTAQVDSQFFFNHNETLPSLHWRHVKFETEHASDTLYFVSEKTTVLNNFDFGSPINLLKPVAEEVAVDLPKKVFVDAPRGAEAVGVMA